MRPKTLTLALALWTVQIPAVATAAPPEVVSTPAALESSPEGWTDLLAGPGTDLKGWSRVPIPPGPVSKPTTPSQWSLDPATRLLTCKGDGGHEWLRWDREVADGVLHVEFRYAPVADKKGHNSGIYARNSADGTVWHQVQIGDGAGGYLFGETPLDGKSKRINLIRDLSDRRVKPAGEWNAVEVTAKGPLLSVWVNGAVTSEFTTCEARRGYLGLEAEGWKIEFRNVKFK